MVLAGGGVWDRHPCPQSTPFYHKGEESPFVHHEAIVIIVRSPEFFRPGPPSPNVIAGNDVPDFVAKPFWLSQGAGSIGARFAAWERPAAYLKSWLEAIRGDSTFIFPASSQASKVADFLLSFVAKVEAVAAEDVPF